MATNGNVNHHDQYPAPAQTSETTANADSSTRDLPKDEVGWYFVEQYYTTLSKSPERLHLFYGKKSQFVSGLEAAIVPVSVGRQAIQERIKEMDFQDSKVRISNVDSQGSEQNIVIQVIGEIANKGEESKKFVQTFVLAQQPSGYFVLNDILRYIDEDQEEVAEPAAEAAEEPTAPAEVPAADEAEAEPEVTADEQAASEQEPAQLDTTVVTQKLEEAAVEAPVAAEEPAVEPAVEAPEPAHTEQAQTQPDVEKTVEEIAEEEVKKPEEPKDPSPTPAVAPATRVAAPAPAQPEKPKEPPKPMSWASRVAAAAGTARPVAPIPKAATPPAAAQPRAPVPAPAQQPAPAAQQAQPAESSAVAPTPKDQGNEWQTAETKRQSRTQPVSAAPAEKEGTMAYIKYVTAKVRDEDLKAALSAFGELAYFDINRTKNCAFVEFKTQAGYNAAVAANPHTVNGENIVVEQRRPKANAYGGTNYNASRGGAGARGSRGGYELSRSGSQGGRGGFTGQSRGRGGAARGRGAAQAGTA